MFSQQLGQQQSGPQIPPQPSRQKLTNYLGVDLQGYQCYQLQPDPVFSKYYKNELHYAISAMQKGFKLPTDIGLKRMKKKNFNKRLALKNQIALSKSTQQPQYIQPLNPQSPELICMKALRRQFREQIAPTPAQDDIKSLSESSQHLLRRVKLSQQEKNAKRKPKFIRKKQNQLRRRIQLISLVKENFQILVKIFGRQKLQGFNKKAKCPKISRQQVKQALAKHYEEKIRQLNDPQYLKKMVDDKIEQKKRISEYLGRQRDHYQQDRAEAERLIRSGNGSSSEVSSSEQSEQSSES